MKIHHLHCGTLCPVTSKIFTGSFLPEIVCHCFLIETDRRLTLVDTGIGREDMLNPSRLGLMAPVLGVQKSNGASSAVEQVRALGYSPSDVSDILVTHMDLDHAGGIPDFPGARVHVHERELAAARTRRSPFDKHRYKAIHVLKESKWEPFDFGDSEWNGFASAREIPGLGSDILAVSLPGHTAGHTGWAVRRGEGWLLHAGDSYYNRREISMSSRGEKPTLPLQMLRRFVHLDIGVAGETQLRLGELTRSKSARVRMVCSHDPAEFRASLSARG